MKLVENLHTTSKQVILITIVSMILSAIFYYYRTVYLQLIPVYDNLFRATRMTLVYVLLPLGWALSVKKFKLNELGITKNMCGRSIILGVGLYSIVLIVFLFLLGKPEFDTHFRWGADYELIDWLLIMFLVAWMAFITDLWSRGFVLMLLAKHQTIWFAILIQNLVWLSAHIYEVLILESSLTIVGALGLTIGIGILGDIIVFKTKNVIGLGVGHIVLNLIFFSFVRSIG